LDNIIIYNTDDGQVRVKLYANDGTVWLTQSQISELFDKNVSTISRHISNIFDEEELEEKSNLRIMQIANSDNRYLPHEVSTRLYAVKLYRSGVGVKFVCRRYHISKASLMR